ncbi:MAG: Ig-like domain repeat protein, partial [Chloroflexi bacterium]
EPGQACNPVFVPAGEYTEVGIHVVTARYDPGMACYQPSELIDEPLEVIKADTTVSITGRPNPSNYPGQDVVLTVTVTANNPGAGVPTGFITLSDLSGHTTTAPVISQTATFTVNPMDTTTYVAVYEGDSNFNPSPPSDPYVQNITQPSTSTPTITTTPESQVTLTPTPVTCPAFVGPVNFNIPGVTNAYEFQISNPAAGTNTSASRIDITWPKKPSVYLTEVRLGALVDSCVSGNCLYQRSNGVKPPSQVLQNGVTGWNGANGGLDAGTTEYMRYVFAGAPPTGDYQMVIDFDNGCRLIVSATY